MSLNPDLWCQDVEKKTIQRCLSLFYLFLLFGNLQGGRFFTTYIAPKNDGPWKRIFRSTIEILGIQPLVFTTKLRGWKKFLTPWVLEFQKNNSKIGVLDKEFLFFFPGKPTCPLKINGWKMYFLLKSSISLGDMFVFEGVRFTSTSLNPTKNNTRGLH